MARPKKDSAADAVASALDLAVSEINKHWGNGVLYVPGEEVLIDRPTLKTGLQPIDDMLGNGGFVRGSIVEIYGLEGTGKSTICLQLMAEAQKEGLKVVFIDQEQSLNAEYAKSLGVDMKDVYVAQPLSMEMSLGIIESLVRTGEIGLVVVDSLASMVPQAELDKTVEETSMGLQAKKMSEWLRRFNPVIAHTNTLLVFTNQMRDNIGFGGGKTTPGGRAIKFYSSYRLEVALNYKVKGGPSILQGGVRVGNNLLITTVKNRFAPPFDFREVQMMFGNGVDKVLATIDMAINYGILGTSGNWYSFHTDMVPLDLLGEDKNNWNGKQTLRTYLMDNPEVFTYLEDRVEEFSNVL